jgi:hydrogenase-4 component J
MPMTARVSLYQLHTKFVNQREDIPEDARQVVYYALAVGHHVGVMDCFSSLVDIPLDEFRAWVERLPESPGRTKLEGVLRFGEIEINRSHVSLLQPLVGADGIRPDDLHLSEQPGWLATLAQCLQGILQEPALYLMLRKYA